MLTKIQRIKKKKDFEGIFKKGASIRNSILVLKILKNSLGLSRFGFVVSQKVSKKAVARNKVRRRLSEIIKSHGEHVAEGLDVALICLPGIEKKEFGELKDLTTTLLAKARVIN